MKHTLKFDVDMYNNTLGSLAITCFMFTPDEEKPTVKFMKNKWKSLKKNGVDFWLDDKDFITKGADLFGLKVPYEHIAMVQSDYNVLFAPFIEDKVMPLREDGFTGITLSTGKVYPITNK